MEQDIETMLIKMYNDVAFKWTFGRDKESRPLIKLLNAVIGYDGLGPVFTELEIKNPYDFNQPLSKQKQGILDIRAKDKKTKIWIDLEIEASSFTYYPYRAMYYLAGMYRDQLPKGKNNYHDLRPCFGIHILTSNIFGGDECHDWFNHFGMLNYNTHKQLNNHFELYFIELDKFQKAFEEGTITWGELEQWSIYLATPQNPLEPLPSYLNNNEEIKEVHKMLRTFTENDRLQEQYRLHDEWLRVQRTEEHVKQKLRKDYLKELQMREYAESLRIKAEKEKEKAEKERENAEKEKEKAEKEREKAEKEREKAEKERNNEKKIRIKAEKERENEQQLIKELEKKLMELQNMKH